MTRMRVFLVILSALSALIIPAMAHLPTGRPFHISGRVYCDTCRAGFETTATTFIEGATVRMECKDGETLGLRFSMQTTTDSAGKYEFAVEDDHGDQICTCELLGSPLAHCSEADPGRSRATAVVTRGNGVHNDCHVVNNMGFFIHPKKRLPGCDKLLKSYFPEGTKAAREFYYN